jgi:hypothetical protein
LARRDETRSSARGLIVLEISVLGVTPWGVVAFSRNRSTPDTVLITGGYQQDGKLGSSFARVSTGPDGMRDADPASWALAKLVAHQTPPTALLL